MPNENKWYYLMGDKEAGKKLDKFFEDNDILFDRKTGCGLHNVFVDIDEVKTNKEEWFNEKELDFFRIPEDDGYYELREKIKKKDDFVVTAEDQNLNNKTYKPKLEKEKEKLDKLNEKITKGNMLIYKKGEKYPRFIEYNEDTKTYVLGKPINEPNSAGDVKKHYQEYLKNKAFYDYRAKKAEISDMIREAFHEFDNNFTKEALHGKVGLPLNHNAYILIDGEPLSAKMGSTWRETAEDKTRAIYIEYLKSDEYRENTEKELMEAIDSGKKIEIYVPDKDMKLPNRPLFLTKDGLIEDGVPFGSEPKDSADAYLLKHTAMANMERVNSYNAFIRFHPGYFRDLFFEKQMKEIRTKKGNDATIYTEVLTSENPLNMKFDRIAPEAFAIAELIVNQHLSFEAAFDHTKNVKEKQIAGDTVINNLKIGNKKYFIDLFNKYQTKAAEYSADKKMDFMDTNQLIQAQNSIHLQANFLVSEMMTFADKLSSKESVNDQNENNSLIKISEFIKGVPSNAEPYLTIKKIYSHMIDSQVAEALNRGPMMAAYLSGDIGLVGVKNDKSLTTLALSDYFVRKSRNELQNDPRTFLSQYHTDNQYYTKFENPIANFSEFEDNEENEAYSNFMKTNTNAVVAAALDGKVDDIISLSTQIEEDDSYSVTVNDISKDKKNLKKRDKRLSLLKEFCAKHRIDTRFDTELKQVENNLTKASFFSMSDNQIPGKTSFEQLDKELDKGPLCVFMDGIPREVKRNPKTGKIDMDMTPADVAYIEPPKPNGFQKWCYSWFGFFKKTNENYANYERRVETKQRFETRKIQNWAKALKNEPDHDKRSQDITNILEKESDHDKRIQYIASSLDVCFQQLDAKQKDFDEIDALKIIKADRYDYVLIDGVPLSSILSDRYAAKQASQYKEEDEDPFDKEKKENEKEKEYRKWLKEENYKQEAKKLISEYCKKGCDVEVYAPTENMTIPEYPIFFYKRKKDDNQNPEINEKRTQSLSILKRMAVFDAGNLYTHGAQKNIFFKKWFEQKKKALGEDDFEDENIKVNLTEKPIAYDGGKGFLSRSQGMAAAIALMVRDGYSLEDALDPEKYIDKKEAAGVTIMEYLEDTGDEEKNKKNSEYIQRLCYDFLSKEKENIQNYLKDVDVTDPESLFSKKAFLPEKIAKLSMDLYDLGERLAEDFSVTGYEKKHDLKSSGMIDNDIKHMELTTSSIRDMYVDAKEVAEYSMGKRSKTDLEKKETKWKSLFLVTGPKSFSELQKQTNLENLTDQQANNSFALHLQCNAFAKEHSEKLDSFFNSVDMDKLAIACLSQKMSEFSGDLKAKTNDLNQVEIELNPDLLDKSVKKTKDEASIFVNQEPQISGDEKISEVKQEKEEIVWDSEDEKKLSEELDDYFQHLDAKFKDFNDMEIDGKVAANRFDYILVDGVPLSSLLSLLHFKAQNELDVKPEKKNPEEDQKKDREYRIKQQSKEYKKEAIKLLERYCKLGCDVEVYAPTEDMTIPTKPVSLSKHADNDKQDFDINERKQRSLLMLNRLAVFDARNAYDFETHREAFFGEWIKQKEVAINSEQIDAESKKKKIDHVRVNLSEKTIAKSGNERHLSRGQGMAAAVALLLREGSSLEDALNPEKEPEKKAAAGIAIMKRLEDTGDEKQNKENSEYIQKLCYDFLSRAKDDAKKCLQDVDVTNPDKLFSKNVILAGKYGSLATNIWDLVKLMDKNFSIAGYEEKKQLEASGATEEDYSDLELTNGVLEKMHLDARKLTEYSMGKRRNTAEEKEEVQWRALALVSESKYVSKVQKETNSKILNSGQATLADIVRSQCKECTMDAPEKIAQFFEKVDTHKLAASCLCNELSKISGVEADVNEKYYSAKIVLNPDLMDQSVKKSTPVEKKPQKANMTEGMSAKKSEELLFK